MREHGDEDEAPAPGTPRVGARERIVAVATAHFVEFGFEATRISAIRAEAGVSNGSFFHHFPTKDMLGAQVYLDIVRDYQASLLDVLTGPPMLTGARLAVERLVRRHLAWVASHRAHAAFVFSESRTDWARLASDALEDCNDRFLETIEDWRGPLVEAGELVDLDLIDFVAQLLGPAQMICRQWLAGHESYSPDLASDALVGCAVRALVNDLGPHAR